MKRRVIASLLTLVLCLTLLPAPAFAEEIGGTTPEPAATDIYVSSTGNDNTGTGSTDNPYATLAKAVDAAGNGATIYVMSDLTMTKCARYYDKDLTITSLDPNDPVTIFRGTEFDTQNDPRSWYNPALIEVQTKGEAERCGLTLHHIILDDKGLHEGSIFAQASSGSGTDQIDNTTIVQDAMIASNATVLCTITLGEGAILRNFGGMSAVRVTESAKLVMKSGSVIEDTLSGYTRSKGTDTRSVGPAGAVWLQGSDFEMKSGAEIKNVNGRAIYADGGEVTVGGTISGITGNPAMWQGKEGTAIHLRGENASAVLASTAVIEEISGGGSAVFVTGVGNRFLTEKGSTIRKLTQTIGVNCVSNKNVQLNGEITEVSGAIPLRLEAANVVLGKDGIIHKNELISHGAAYVHNSSNLTIYGKINDNYSSSGKNAAALFIVNNGPASHATLEQGGEICNNTNGGSKYGAAVELQQDSCSFTMNGGTISGNSGPCGAVQVRKGSAKFIMNGGKVTGNTSTTRGEAGIYVEDGTPTVELKAGKAQSVTLAKNVSASPSKGHVYISDRFDLESGLVAMVQDAKTVTPAEDSLDIKLGNASTESKNALTAAAAAKGWNTTPLATFWTQRDGAAELMIDGLTLDAALPQIVYALVQETGEDGKPASGAEVRVYSTEITADGIRLTLPNGYANGCAVALVQPTTDFGSVVITGPATIEKDSAAATYEVPYTATYTMSDTLLNMLKRAPRGVPMTFVVELDSRLTAKKDDNGNFRYNFNGDGILEVDKSNITVSPDGHTITVVCKPVADWTTAIGGKTSVKMTLTGTGVLAAENFAAGEYLNTTGHIVGMIDQSTSVLIPANLCRTKMIGRYDVIFDWNDGSNKKKTVSVVEGGTVGDQMPADPSRSGYTFTGWNTKTDGTGNVFTSTTNVTDDLTVYAQWKRNGGGGGSTNYYLALKKVDAQDGHALSGAQFGLYQDGKQLATATSDRNGLVMFTLSSKNYKNLYCQELIAPEGYVMNKDKITVSANDLTTSRTTAEKSAETVRNYRGVTPDLLNDADHFAYVIGYPDGAVRPQGNITRAETATIFFRLLKDAVRNGNLLTSNAYQDVASSYWANTAISTMTGLGILQGRDSATFDPNAPITRAEFAAICARFDTGKSSGSQTFSDIRGHWAQDYIERAAELGWVKGFEDGTFRPNDCITRAQAMTMINRVLNRIPEDASDLLPDMNVWPDCNPGDWFYLAVQEATNSHNYKHKAGNYETWISMKQDPDWTRYEN